MNILHTTARRLTPRWRTGTTLSALLLFVGCSDRASHITAPEPVGGIEQPVVPVVPVVASMVTDRLGYLPGDTVVISGMGYRPYETVRIVLVDDNREYKPVSLTAVADANGEFRNAEHAAREHTEAARYTLTATGVASGGVATASFVAGHDQPAADHRYFRVGDVTTNEGSSGDRQILIPVYISSVCQNYGFNIGWQLESLTASAGSDYVAASGTLAYPANASVAYLVVTVRGDEDVEPDEAFQVRLTTLTGGGGVFFTSCYAAGFSDALGLITLRNDDVAVDGTPPNIAVSVNGAAPTDGWLRDPAVVDWTVSDGESTVTSQSEGCADVTVAGDGVHAFRCEATSTGGSAARDLTVRVDRSAPTFQPTLLGTQQNGVWLGDVTVKWNVSEPTSPLTATCPDQVVPASQAGVVSCTATNAAGLSATAQVHIGRDNTAPELTGQADRAPNAAGWYDSDVTITWTASDAESGITSACGPTTVSSTTPTQGATVSCTATNGVGLSTSRQVTVRLDKSGPMVAAIVPPATGANGWHAGDVTVAWNVTDPESGIAAATCTPTTIAANTDGTTVECTATNNAGRSTTQHATVKVDKTAPTLSHVLSGTLGENGWYVSDVSIAWSALDDISGATACPAATLATNAASHLFECTAVNGAGLRSAPAAIAVKRDVLKPAITLAAPAPDGANGWYRSPVTVGWSYQQAVSGTNVTSGCATTTQSTDTPGMTIGCAVKTGAGIENAATHALKLDATAPTLSGRASTSEWTNADVTVTWDCDDATSGVQACPAPSVVGTEGANQSASASVTDRAGNGTRTNVGHINIDKTAPTVTGVASTTAWTKQDVTVSWECADALSGIQSCPSLTVVATEGANQSVTGTGRDRAGNAGSASVGNINVDKTGPTITGTASATGWTNRDVTVSFTCTDALSGVASCAGPVTVTTEGANQSRSGSATDHAGNGTTSTVSGISIDKTAPTIVGSASTAGWTNADVAVSFRCSDALSGVAACQSPTMVSTEGANQSVSGTVQDHAGNGASATVSNINIDRTNPTIALSAAATYTVDQTVVVACTPADALSGIATSSCPAAVAAHTLPLGTNTLSATAMDRAGNGHSASVNFTVEVTTGSLATLVPVLVPDAGVANALVAKLDAVAAARNATARAGQIQAFVNEVEAQAGKKISTPNAATLIRLARSL